MYLNTITSAQIQVREFEAVRRLVKVFGQEPNAGFKVSSLR